MSVQRVIDPASGALVRTYPLDSEASLEAKLAAAAVAKIDELEVRLAILTGAAKRLRERREELAGLMALEMGKPITQGRAEVEKCALGCEHYLAHAASYLADEIVQTEARKSYVAYRPLGVTFAIMPWNFPLWQVFRHALPSIAAGNAVLLKHAENVPGCALAIESIFREAGAPAGIFATLLIDREGAAKVIRDPRVALVALTGSTRAGRSVGAEAGRAIKKCVLELGGSDPYVVLEDADLEEAAKTCAKGRLVNSGQSCIAAKRFIIVEKVRARFEELMVAEMRTAKMGPPLDERTEVGPQAREDLRAQLHAQVEASVKNGARAILGGELPMGSGFFYPPTVLSGVTPGMAAFDEETFGPVAALIAARDEDHAILLANRSPYGLGAAVFTRDLARGERIARERLDAGSCFVNAFVRSDPRLPFGGVRESGYGRELSRHGLLELVNAKTVYVQG